MTVLRLIADDLTGALDTAAQFAAAAAIPVHWSAPRHLAGTASVAIDSRTRDAEPAAARATVADLAARLPRDADGLFYAKLDSLLRGQAAAEIAGWIEALKPAHAILAPAFPHHGRITRDGIQRVRTAEGWQPVGAGLRAALEREGVPVRRCRPGDPVPPGLSLWDAESDADLAAIATAGRALDAPVLWCGSAGLATALADAPRCGPIDLPRPILGLFGTDHPVTAGQLAACGPLAVELPDGTAESETLLTRRLERDGIALARLALPALPRDVAAVRIAEKFARLVTALPAPGTLMVAGGETLHGLCVALGAERLDLDGQIEPGVPRSILRGGRYDGVRVVSKSGAFGDPALLRRLLSPIQGAPTQGEQA